MLVCYYTIIVLYGGYQMPPSAWCSNDKTGGNAGTDPTSVLYKPSGTASARAMRAALVTMPIAIRQARISFHASRAVYSRSKIQRRASFA